MDEVNGDVTHWFALSENEAHFSLVCSGQCVQHAGKKQRLVGKGGGVSKKTTCNTRIKLITG